MANDPGDEKYYPDQVEKPPQVVACVIHQMRPSVEQYTVKEKEGFQVVHYGLCAKCKKQLETDKTFMVFIDKTICRRLDAIPKGDKK